MDEHFFPIPNEHSTEDDLLEICGSLIGQIPIVGGGMELLLFRVITPPLEARRDEWLNDLGKKVARVLSRLKGITPEVAKAILQSDEFLDATMQAASSAIKTSNEEKREALRNAVLNTAVQRGPDKHLQAIYLSLVNSLTPSHLILLREVAVPHPESPHTDASYPYPDNIRYRVEKHALAAAFPDEVVRTSVGKLVYKDLVGESLIEPSTWGRDFRELQIRMKRPELMKFYRGDTFSHLRSTEFGLSFLRFISEPPELQDSPDSNRGDSTAQP